MQQCQNVQNTQININQDHLQYWTIIILYDNGLPYPIIPHNNTDLLYLTQI